MDCGVGVWMVSFKIVRSGKENRTSSLRSFQMLTLKDDQDCVASHPFRDQILRDTDRFVPLKLHGDDAKGFHIISWTSLMCTVIDQAPACSAAADDGSRN